MQDILNIKLEILQRPYSVRVKREDEELFRKASSSIEESIQRYASKGGVYRDKQDLLAMALLENTLAAIKTKQENDTYKQAIASINKLGQIDAFLDSSLN